MPEKRKTPAFVSRPLLAAVCFQNQAILVIPAGFEPTACRLGGDRSILLSYGTSFSKVLICQGFRDIGDCSPWCLGVVLANQEGRFLIGFSNFGGGIFSHLLILTLWIRGVGLIPFLGHFRTLRPFSVSRKAAVGLFLRRRTLYPAELRVQRYKSGKRRRIIAGLRVFCKG